MNTIPTRTTPTSVRATGAAILSAACLWAAPALAQTMVTNTIYQDQFSGTAGSALNGRTPDTVDTGGAKWSANTNWTINGSGYATVPANNPGCCAFLPFVPQQGQVYLLSGTMEDTLPNDTNYSMFVALGFTATLDTANGAVPYTPPVAAVGWVGIRNEGETSPYPNTFYLGPSVGYYVLMNSFYPPANSLNSFTIILDATPSSPADWTFACETNGVVLAGPVAFGGSGPTINYILLAGITDPAIVQNVTLQSVYTEQAPAITTQPESATNWVGDTATLSVTATGAPLYFQWAFDTTNIPGATSSALVLAPVAFTNAGTYQVVISNSLGSVTSAPATLTVLATETVPIYQDEFSGAASSALNGRMPDTVDTGGAAWIASPYWTIDGSGDATVQAVGSAQDAFLPFVPAQGYIYTLSASMDDPSSGTSWICMGFTESAGTATFFPYLGSTGWEIVLPDGSTYSSGDAAYLGPGGAGGVGEFYYPTGMANYAVILDARPAASSDWTFTWEINGVVVVGPTAFGGSGPTINYVALGNNLDAGVVRNFALTELSLIVPPAITIASPSTLTTYVGMPAVFQLQATVDAGVPFTNQWQTDGGLGGSYFNIGAPTTGSAPTTATLTVNTAGWAVGTYNYQLMSSDSAGTNISPIVTVNVVPLPSVPAQGIAWGPAANINGDWDVITNGIGIYAFGVGPAPVTVNGVTFTEFDTTYTGGYSYNFSYPASIVNGNVSLVTVLSGFAYYNLFGEPDPPFNQLSANYQDLLTYSTYGVYNVADSSSDFWTLSFGNLVPGLQYDVQLWLNESRGYRAGETETLSDPTGANATGDLFFAVGNGAAGELGTYVIGTGNADTNGNLAVTISDGTAGALLQITAFQLRQTGVVTPTTVGIGLVNGNMQVSWTGPGYLQQAPALTGPWTTTPNGGVSPYTIVPSASQQFYRLVQGR